MLTVKRFLSQTPITAPLRRVLAASGIRKSPEHGHQLLLDFWEELPHAPTIVEVGTTREAASGQDSTAKLAAAAFASGGRLISVDMDPVNTRRADRRLAGRFQNSFQAVTSKGEDFLLEFDGTIDGLYLDAFDLDHGQHSRKRIESYTRNLGIDITTQASEEMHLQCAIHARSNLSPQAIVVFDDTWRADGRWQGKGATAIPYMLDHGFIILAEGHGGVAMKAD